MAELLGIVRNNQFVALTESAHARRLTALQPSAAAAPESEELDLRSLEGKTISVHGIDQGDWVYAARVQTTQVFRANVGIAIVNDVGDVLALERATKVDGTAEYVGTDEWQMAQGGLDELEEPAQGAERELREELGLSPNDVTLLFEHPDWLAYELPQKARRAKHGRGQVQKWFFYRLTADEGKIDLTGSGHEREFMRFQWMSLATLAAKAWDVRRPVYEKLAAALSQHLADQSEAQR